MTKDNTSPPAVLIVDDEESIRRMVRRILEMDRYEVVDAGSGDEALILLDQNPRIDLVVADLAMPGLQGDEMVQRMRAKRPDLKVLFLTGYADLLFERLPVLWEGQAFLDKPFTAKGLLEAVSLLLFGTIKRGDLAASA